MANTKISALTSLTGANVALTTDVLPVVDTSVTTTKKITADELGIGLDTRLPTLTALTGANVVGSTDLVKIWDASASASRKITASELSIAVAVSTDPSSLTALTGANVALTTDLLNIWDTSATVGKKITPDELGIAISLAKVGLVTRVMTAASGAVAYTGIGFKPKIMYFMTYVAGAGGSLSSSKGFDDGTTAFGLLDYTLTGADPTFTGSQTISIYGFDDAAGANTQSAKIQSLDADGFTLIWTKAGTPTATLTIGYMAVR